MAPARRRPRPRPRADTMQETRAALIAAALEEFAEHGLDVPSLDAICARAGYTRGAFYVHFRDRTELMAAAVEQAMGAFLDAVIARDDTDRELERTIERFASAIVEAMAPRGRGTSGALPLPAGVPFARILDAVTRTPVLRARFSAVLVRAVAGVAEVAAHGQRAGSVRDDVETGALATVLVMLALGVLVALDVGLAFDPASLRTTVLRLMAAPRGRTRRQTSHRPSHGA